MRYVFTLVLLAAACGKKNEAPAVEKDPQTTKTTEEGFSRPKPPLPEGPVGVAECDDYITKYLACLPKMQRPEVAQAIEKAVMDSKRAWRSVAQNEQNKLALKEACLQATASAKQALAMYNCDW